MSAQPWSPKLLAEIQAAHAKYEANERDGNWWDMSQHCKAGVVAHQHRGLLLDRLTEAGISDPAALVESYDYLLEIARAVVRSAPPGFAVSCGVDEVIARAEAARK